MGRTMNLVQAWCNSFALTHLPQDKMAAISQKIFSDGLL